MIRAQRSRAKGARLPPRTLCCTRPGKWANPLKVPKGASRKELDQILQDYGFWLDGSLMLGKLDLKELAVYDHLACWCRLDSPCHVDIIIDRFHSSQEGDP